MNPHHTIATDEMRADALKRIPRRLLKLAIQVLNRDRFGPLRTNGGVFEHNCITLAAAMAWAERGVPVVDGHCLDELGQSTSSILSPKVPRGAKWQEEATIEIRKLIKRWTGEGFYPVNRMGRRYRYAHLKSARNYNIATRWPFAALDLDRAAGMAWREEYIAAYGDFPITPTQRTGSGQGLQYLFRLPPGVVIHNTASAIAPGVDIRGAGGQIVGPYSLHPSGGYYMPLPGLAGWEVDVAMIPDVILEAALAASKKTGSGPRAERTRREGGSYAQGGARDRNSFAWDYEAKLDRIGEPDDQGHEGFDGPIRDAALQFFWECGTDGEPEDLDYLKSSLRAAIIAAPCKDGRNVGRYAQDFYLDDRIDNALEFRRSREAEWDAQRAAELTDDGDGGDEPDNAPIADDTTIEGVDRAGFQRAIRALPRRPQNAAQWRATRAKASRAMDKAMNDLGLDLTPITLTPADKAAITTAIDAALNGSNEND